MNPLPLPPLFQFPTPQVARPGIPQPPIIMPPPMLQPGAIGMNNINGVVYGQFPDANIAGPEPMAPPGPMMAGISGAEEPTSGYRDLGGAPSPDAVPEGPGMLDQAGSAAGGILDKLLSRQGLAAIGMGLSGLGPAQFQNPLLQRAALQQMQQRQQAQGYGLALQAISNASKSPDPGQAMAAFDEAMKDPRIQQSPEAMKALISARTPFVTQALQSNEARMVGQVLRGLPGGRLNREEVITAAASSGIPVENFMRIASALDPRFRSLTLATGQPAEVDRSTGGYTAIGPSKREVSGGQVVAPYEDQPLVSELPRTDTLSPGQRLVRSTPGQPSSTITSVPERPTDQTRRGAEILGIDVTGDPAKARMAASVGLLAEKFSREDLLTAAQQGTLAKLIPGLLAPEQAGPVAQAILDAEQARRVATSSAQGAEAARIREQAEQSKPAISVEGLKSGDNEVYDRQTGKYVNKLAPNFMETVQQEPDRYRTVQGDDLKSLRAVRGIERFVPLFEEVAKKLTDQPGANITQQIEFALKERLGIASMGTVVSTLQGSQLVLAKAFQGTGSQLSDADRKTVEGLVPKAGDTTQQVAQKVNFLKTYTRLIKSVVLDDDAAADNALVDFVKRLPPSANVPAAPDYMVPRRR